MPHELIVGLAIKIAETTPPELGPLASRLYPLVSGVEAVLRFSIKNVGANPFPGGKISELAVDIAVGMGSVQIRPRGITDIAPALDRSEEKPLCEWRFLPSVDGVAGIRVGLQANDGGQVNLKRSEDDSPKNPLEFVVPVGKLADVLTIFELVDIGRKLDLLKSRIDSISGSR